jgi:galactosyl transferase GMA12/MNN10 family
MLGSLWPQPAKSLRKSNKDTRFVGAISRLSLAALLLCALVSTISTLIWTFKHLQCYSREATVVWKEGAAHTMHRECPKVPYLTKLSTKMLYTISKREICLVTLSDSALVSNSTSGGASKQSWWHRLIRCRNFDAVAKLTWPNHKEYARKQGYTIRDQSRLLDPSRPPAWSKIRAVQAMMNEPFKCEWVLWLDADVVIMDSYRLVESLIPHDATSSDIDLIVTTDRRFTANSGVWLMRNSAWSRQFLEDWWNSKSFVRPNGLSLSGDNDAFGHLIRERLGLSTVDVPTALQLSTAIEATKSPIRFIARCNMNSFGVFVPKTSSRSRTNTTNIQQEEWYLSDQWYHDGDFIAHASGVDQKAAAVQMLLKRAK